MPWGDSPLPPFCAIESVVENGTRALRRRSLPGQSGRRHEQGGADSGLQQLLLVCQPPPPLEGTQLASERPGIRARSRQIRIRLSLDSGHRPRRLGPGSDERRHRVDPCLVTASNRPSERRLHEKHSIRDIEPPSRGTALVARAARQSHPSLCFMRHRRAMSKPVRIKNAASGCAFQQRLVWHGLTGAWSDCASRVALAGGLA